MNEIGFIRCLTSSDDEVPIFDVSMLRLCLISFERAF